MATTTIPWGDGSGDNIYLTYPSASGDQAVEVSSDANTGAARSKVVSFTSAVGSVMRQLTVSQEAGETPGGRVSDYVQDGLVLHLDGKQKGNTADAWTSLVGSHVFTNTGATLNSDHVYFDGKDDYMSNSSFTSPAINSGTIEVCADLETTNYGSSRIIFCGKTTSSFIANITSAGYINWSLAANNKKTIYKLPTPLCSFSVSNALARCNGSSMTTNTANYSSGNSTSYNRLGRRSSGNYLKGKIYSIRIYNRQLTEEEVLQNLSVDNIRFGLGLTL